MANEFVIKNGFISQDNSSIKGSLSATTYFGDGSNLTGISSSGGFSGGTVTGSTIFTNGLSANTISATTISGGTFYGDGSGLTNITVPTGTTTGSFGININNGNSVITTGFKAYVKLPYNGTIIGWTIMSTVSGSISFNILKDSQSNFPPTSGDTIVGGNYPSLTNQIINSDNTLTGWTTSFSANDIFSFEVLSAASVTNINLTINVIKT